MCPNPPEDQPFILNSISKGLLGYRQISMNQHFSTGDAQMRSLVYRALFRKEVPHGVELAWVEGCQKQSVACISIIGSASYVFDHNVLGFYEACSELHLLRGEGIAGKAPGTNQPCFATVITGFSRTEYSLPDHAKLF
ncbi:hypothetical protein Tco_0983642 [Tanacetum coccineum]